MLKESGVKVGLTHFFSMGEMENPIVERIKDLVKPILEEEGIDLVEIEFRPKGKRWLLRLYIDKEGGINIGDCEKVSRELSTLLDVEDLIDHPYTLEVSSPGLTRQLKRAEEFKKYKGRLCRIITKRALDGRTDFLGEIGEVQKEGVELKGKDRSVIIPFEAIKKANLEFQI
ncbi:MAG: ribosome maturation factor RimP [Desulfobacterota bacterium]|nr:ribosome maturation factor RimP [Thermodesulfobacteriota bacterium]